MSSFGDETYRQTDRYDLYNIRPFYAFSTETTKV